MAMATITCGSTELVVSPELGGSILSLRTGGQDVLTPAFPHPKRPAHRLAGIILTPFSNRIGDGSFPWQGQHLPVPRNLADEPFPIHGDGFLRAWAVTAASQTDLRLRLDEGFIGPFRYAAEQRFTVTPGSFSWSVTITNLADDALPYGLGFHPWFPRTPATLLQFEASGVWLQDDRHLPFRSVTPDTIPAWDFRQAKALPAEEIDHAFTSWNGRAKITQGLRHASLDIEASGTLTTAIVYAPQSDSTFFCFEPVSHPINAHNMPEHPGLLTLSPGQSTHATMTLRWKTMA